MSTLNLGDSLILDSDYSESEVKTGATWIDGKPIYRQVFTGTLTSYADASTRRVFAYGVTNWTSTHTFIRAYGNYKVSQGNVYNLGSNHQSGTNTSLFSDAIGPEGTSLNFRFYSTVSQGITSVEYSVVVEYTKTTD